MAIERKNLIKISDYIWEIPKSFKLDMQVPARVFASEKMLNEILADNSINQLINVATLPGIQKYALAMPDAHEGYGFPVGGVAGFDSNEGIISPGGIGYDINCGVRLLKSNLNYDEVKAYLPNLAKELYREIPSGVGRGGRLNLNYEELDKILKYGAKRIIEIGYGNEKDLEHIESNGFLKEAEPEFVSKIAKERGRDQLGTIGAGNHFVEVDKISEIFDEETAKNFGLFKDQICVLIHTGSRGLGHQVATDYIRKMISVLSKYKINLADKELACAPFSSLEGQEYFKAMSAAANFAWANRELITWEVRRAWQKVLGKKEARQLEILYDVAHNIAKIEEYKINNEIKKLIVHRKGATRAFLNQPVLIPGSMGTASYVLLGQEKSLEISFGSTCHGAGRRMSRAKAKKQIRGSELKKELENKGIVIEAGSMSGLAEEAPQAYKDVSEVVEVVHQLGIAKKIAKLKPIAVIKG
ncbi:MAG: RtcB family protein [Minisyncoccia bacterium]